MTRGVVRSVYQSEWGRCSMNFHPGKTHFAVGVTIFLALQGLVPATALGASSKLASGLTPTRRLAHQV